MGGRIALKHMIDYHWQPKALVLLSANVFAYDLQKRLEWERNWELFINQADVSTFLDHWYAQPLFHSLRQNHSLYQSMLTRRLTLSKKAILSEWNFGKLTENALDTNWSEKIVCPVLGIYGEEDEKYRDLYNQFFPKKFSGVLEASHAVHLEAPKELANKIISFLQEIY